MQVIFSWVLVLTSLCATAQKSRTADSTGAAQALQALANICKQVDFADAEVQKQGFFYKAAPFIIYRGKNTNRKWKSFCNYRLPEDKQGVDHICERINRTINQAGGYNIVKYFTETESEGTWHALLVTFTTQRGQPGKAVFAFLKIGKRFGLGDIDNQD